MWSDPKYYAPRTPLKPILMMRPAAFEQVANDLAFSQATLGNGCRSSIVTSRRGGAAVDSARSTAYRSIPVTSRRRGTADEQCCHPSPADSFGLL